MKKLLSLILILTLILGVFCLPTATAQENKDLHYIVAKDNTVHIVGYSGTDEILTIPDTIDSYAVTVIASNAFADNNILKKVYLPDTVTTIDYNAFRNCFNLDYVKLPQGLTLIKERAFENCRKLNIQSLPESLEYIGGNAFSDCEAVTKLNIPEGVTYIGHYAFSWCTNLSEISLPSNLEYIGSNVLYKTAYSDNPDNWEGGCLYYDKYLLDTNAEFLGEIHIKEGIEILSDSVFMNSDARTITMPDTVTKLSSNCFSYCIFLRNISLSPNIKEIPPYTFDDCDDLTAIEIPHGVTTIGEKAFWNCIELSYIEIPSSVVEIAPLSIGYTEYDFSMDINPENKIKSEILTIAGYKGSAAEKYAKENGFAFKALDANYKEQVLPLLGLSENQIGANQKTLAYHEEYEYYSELNTTATPDFALIGIYERAEMNIDEADFYGGYVIRSHAEYFPEVIKYYIYLPDSKTIFSLRQAYSASPDEISNIFTQGTIGELIGDVNYDRELNIKDVTLIQKEMAKIQYIEDNFIGHSPFADTTGMPQYIGDFNRDGKMNIRDATEIQKHLAGIDKNDPNSDNVETNPLPKPPAKITFDGKTYEAQVGDTVTLSMELSCSTVFNSISATIKYDTDIITVAPLDKDSKEEWYKAHLPNLPRNNLKYYGYNNDSYDMGKIALYPFDQDGMDFTEKKLVYSFDFVVVGGGDMNLDANLESIRLQYDGVLFENGKPVGDTVVDYSYSFKVN